MGTHPASFLMATGFSLEEEFYLFASLATLFLLENISRILSAKFVPSQDKQ